MTSSKRSETIEELAQKYMSHPVSISPSESMETKLVVLLKYLPELRAQGVLTLRVDGLEATFEALPTQAVEAESATPLTEQGRDPQMYGLPPGTKLPTLAARIEASKR